MAQACRLVFWLVHGKRRKKHWLGDGWRIIQKRNEKDIHPIVKGGTEGYGCIYSSFTSQELAASVF